MEPEPEPEPDDMISSVKSRRLMAMQAKKEKEEMDRQNKGELYSRKWSRSSILKCICHSEKS